MTKTPQLFRRDICLIHAGERRRIVAACATVSISGACGAPLRAANTRARSMFYFDDGDTLGEFREHRGRECGERLRVEFYAIVECRLRASLLISVSQSMVLPF